jgi:hypothetical protein
MIYKQVLNLIFDLEILLFSFNKINSLRSILFHLLVDFKHLKKNN